ncbi:hypothetical protein PInf_027996 [Phytophthora infestans]|nr:hypothetical protein PInf_027996 [Phytophthora infestans]
MHRGRASTKVSWLKITDPDVVDFMHGVKDLGPSVTGGGKRMDKTDKLLSFSFATTETDSLHVLVRNVPEYVKESLQEFLEKKALCNKMESAEGCKEDSADDIDDSASQRLSAAMHPGRASTNVSWLKITDPDVVDFMHGVKDLGPSVTGGGKRMDKTDKLLSFNFATAEADSLHVLVLKVPEYVKESLQEFLEKKALCNKMESAEGWYVSCPTNPI